MMRRKSYWIAALLMPLLALFVACNDDEGGKSDTITIDGDVKELVFPYGNPADQTITFTASTAWKVDMGGASWVVAVPVSGQAGEATVTIRLSQPTTKVDRETTATIISGSAKAPFVVKQLAPVAPTAIAIEAPQKTLPIGKSMNLVLKAEPENANLGFPVWSSSDKAVVTVEQNGKVSGVSAGKATITATVDGLTAECELEVTEAFTTDGSGREYTFKQLSELESSGVVATQDSYVVTANIVIAEGDKLVLGDNELVKLDDNVEIKVLGMIDFTPELKASVVPSSESAEPKPIYFTEKGGGEISNVVMSCPIRHFGSSPLTIIKCTFTGILSNWAAINLGGGGLTTVSECQFLGNAYPAIAGGANIASPLLFKNNSLIKNSATASNRPQINVTVGGDYKVEIIGNTIVGPGEITKNGGIAVANMLGIGGPNEVLIEGNKVSDCRYGITTNGTMNVRIIDNVLENNKWDTNPMTGGSGVSISNSNGGQKIYMKGNTIKGHLWGITSIGNTTTGKGPELNLGNQTQGANYNPGGNVFKDNGNGGVLYDLYNNSPITVYAQGNTWNVATQDQASIEGVIVHKVDDAKFGEVIFMPAAQ